MSPRADKLLEEVMSLPPEEQDELIDRLLDAAGPPLTELDRMTDDEFAAELERRHQELVNDPSLGVPWEEVFRRSREE